MAVAVDMAESEGTGDIGTCEAGRETDTGHREVVVEFKMAEWEGAGEYATIFACDGSETMAMAINVDMAESEGTSDIGTCKAGRETDGTCEAGMETDARHREVAVEFKMAEWEGSGEYGAQHF